jgi:hypothetical protein
MGTLLDLASLVTIPSGYKVGTVYSVVPTDGAGDLTFTRSNDTATRVGPNGLIEKVRTNLYPSNIGAFVGYTLGPNASDGGQVAGPTGAMNARRIIMSAASNAFINYTLTIPSAGTYTFSLFVRLVSGTAQNRPLIVGGTDLVFMNALPNSTWTRVYGTFTTSLSGSQMLVLPFYDSVATVEYSQIQWEAGDIVTDYIPTTTTAVSVGPVANLPRLDYLNSTCPNLLLEPQRTNILQYSEQIDNTRWVKETGNSITANSIASPDGYIDADTITATSGNVLNVNQGLTISTTGAHTFSAFLKKKNTSVVSIYLFTTHLGPQFVAKSSLNFDTGVVTTDFGTATLVNYGNGWYRLSVTGTLTATTTCTCGFYTDSTTGTRDVYAYGAQVELGAYGTSYVPTLAAASTRGADSCSKTGISSLIGQTEGVLFSEFDFVLDTGSAGILGIDGGGTTFAYLFIGASNTLNFNIYNAGSPQAALAFTLPSSGRYKIAGAYKANDFVLYVNGVQRASDTSGSVPACSILSIDSTTYGLPPNLRMSESILFETRLTNAELAQLTTL